MKREDNNIIYDAYYLINKFNENHNDVTNLQIQKLMYFFEAYYMNIYEDVDKLYECNFNAWAYGPVAIPLYKEFKKFGNDPIILSDEDRRKGKEISQNKKKLLDNIYVAFRGKSSIELVKLTHMKNSPWDKVWKENGEKVGYGASTYIDKSETKEWFKKTFEKK